MRGRTIGHETVTHHPDAPDWLDGARSLAPDERPALAFEDDEGIRVVPLSAGWTRIGRSASSDIRLDDETVSRRHVVVVKTADGARVLDDRSLNGTFVNGERIDWAHVAEGDEIGVGRYRLFLV